MLQGRRADVGAAVVGGVIIPHAADEGEIDARDARRQERRQVGVVGQPLVDFGIDRRGRGMRRRARIKIDQRGIARTGLEQKAGALVAPRLDIHHRAGAGDIGGIAGIGGGAQQGLLFSVSEKRGDGTVVRQMPRLQGTQRLQDHGHARAVIGGAGTARNGIGVRHQQHRAPGAGNGARGDVGDGGADLPAAAVTTLPHAFFVRDAEPRQFALQPGAEGRGGGRAAGARHFRSQQPRQYGIGAGGGEHRGGGIGGQRRRPCSVYGQKPESHRQKPQQPDAQRPHGGTLEQPSGTVNRHNP